MRLTNKMREEIIQRVVDLRKDDKEAKIRTKILDMSEALIAEKTRFIDVESMKKYLHCTTNFSLNLDSVKDEQGRSVYAYYSGYLNKEYPCDHKYNGHRIPLKGEVKKAYNRLIAFQKSNKTFRADLRQLVFSVSSTKELYMILPEAEKFVDRELVERLKKNLK